MERKNLYYITNRLGLTAAIDQNLHDFKYIYTNLIELKKSNSHK